MMELTEKLLDICKENKIEEALRECEEWKILYHLSPVRENLLEWYQFEEDSTLLEIGAETGAMTGLLAKKVQQVTCLETDQNLTDVNKQRNQQFKNVEFRVGKIDQVQENEKFDYITLIGTLERAFTYCEANNPYIALLKECKTHLNENGMIILAIDNKTGMKYWSGAPEHTTSRPFSGICNNYKEKEGKSFTKNEIECILKQCGLEQIEFYYPVPDYRFVSTLYSEKFLPQSGELRLGNSVYEPGGYQFFEEDLAYDTVCKDGQYPYFAESFLIFAKK